MVNCAVVGCKNYSDRKDGDKNIRYYTFPKKLNIRNQWMKLCGRKDKFNVKNARICSIHFSEKDWKLEDVLLDVSENKRRLKEDAIPSINLPVESSTSERQSRYNKKIQKQLVEDAMIGFYGRYEDN